MMRAARVLLTLAVIAGAGHAAYAQPPSDLDPRIVQLVGQVSTDRLTATLKKLESFGTRNTMSSPDSPTDGIGAARQWSFNEFKSYGPKLQVSYDTYIIAKQGRITHDVEARNIMAVLPGRSPRRIYVSGHYDTVAIADGGQSARNAA